MSLQVIFIEAANAEEILVFVYL